MEHVHLLCLSIAVLLRCDLVVNSKQKYCNLLVHLNSAVNFLCFYFAKKFFFFISSISNAYSEIAYEVLKWEYNFECSDEFSCKVIRWENCFI